MMCNMSVNGRLMVRGPGVQFKYKVTLEWTLECCGQIRVVSTLAFAPLDLDTRCATPVITGKMLKSNKSNKAAFPNNTESKQIF